MPKAAGDDRGRRARRLKRVKLEGVTVPNVSLKSSSHENRRLRHRACRRSGDVRRPAPRRGHSQGEISPLKRRLPPTKDGLSSSARRRPSLIMCGCSTASSAMDARGCTVVPGFVDAHTHVVHARRSPGRTAAATRRCDMRRNRSRGRRHLADRSRDTNCIGGARCARTRAPGRNGSVRNNDVRSEERIWPHRRIGTASSCAPFNDSMPSMRSISFRRFSVRTRCRWNFAAARRLRHARRRRHDSESRMRRSQNGAMCSAKRAFTPEQSARILQAGMRSGLRPRIHADELGTSGGARVAAESARARRIWSSLTNTTPNAWPPRVCAVLLPTTTALLSSSDGMRRRGC